MKRITTDIFYKLFIYSIAPVVLLLMVFGILMMEHVYQNINEIAHRQVEMMNNKLEDEIEFFDGRIAQRIDHSIHRYGSIQDDLKYFIYRVKELYDIYIVDKNGKVIDGESKFYRVDRGKPLNIDNHRYHVDDMEVMIRFDKDLADGNRVVFRLSIRKILEMVSYSNSEFEFFVVDKMGNVIYDSDPSIYVKRINLKGLGFLESGGKNVSGYYPLPTETGSIERNYINIIKDLNDELIYGVKVNTDLLRKEIRKIYLQTGMIFVVYLLILYLIAKYLSKYLSNPIIALKRFSEEASKSENLNFDEKDFPDNELRILAKNIYESFLKIKRLKDELFITLMSIGDGVIVTDNNGKVEMMNQVAEKITGYKNNESVGKPLVEIFKINNEITGVQVENPIERALREGKIVGLANKTVLTDKNGNRKIISDSAAPIIVNGEVKGAILVFRDDTEKEKFKKEMIRKEQIETIGLVAGGIAHDFNNILSAINNYMLVAKMNFGENEKVVEFANNVITLCGTGKFLANKLLVLSKGGEHMTLVGTDLFSLISETARFVLSGTNIKYEIKKTDYLCYGLVDQNLVAQIFHNLLINAKQAMPEGGEINIGIEIDDSFLIHEKPSIKITVKDTGPGIPEDVIDNIFQPFFTTKQHGSGLGLYIVKTIVEKHDGRISVESVRGKGTTFTINLPASDKCGIETVKVDKEVEADRFCHKILIMDDEYFVRDSLGMVFEGLGCEVFMAEDGDEALKIYKEHLERDKKFDIVFLDITVPIGKGAKYTIEKLKIIDPDVKAVVMSGYTDSDIMENYKSYGFIDVLSKPYDRKRIIEILREIGG
ncbi:MAG: ATP-binding protein [Calditerrivibrio sp.]|uniref:two-component system sensor histidine kinase NtrB n=1 Tax=Calditerrivibrio sp. TaxID=2792612 RepID=UPI003D0EF7F6